MDDKTPCACQKWNASTIVAAALTLLFVLFMFSTTLMVRWWLMVPMALAAFFLFKIQRGQTEGTEKQVCDWGYFVIIVAFLLRDICLSSRLTGILSHVAEFGGRMGVNI